MGGNCRFAIARLEAWAPGIASREEWAAWAAGTREIGAEGAPALTAVPALLRRRFDRQGRMAAEVACAVLEEARGIPLIFCSRHGETTRSVQLLQELLQERPVSPAAFTLSVHNAILGLFSMVREDRANGTALAGGREGVVNALVEACGLLADGHRAVLLVVYDEPLTGYYEAFRDEAEYPFAWAALLTADAEDRIELGWQPGTAGLADGALSQGLAVLRFLLSDAPELRLPGAACEWVMRRAG